MSQIRLVASKKWKNKLPCTKLDSVTFKTLPANSSASSEGLIAKLERLKSLHPGVAVVIEDIVDDYLED